MVDIKDIVLVSVAVLLIGALAIPTAMKLNREQGATDTITLIMGNAVGLTFDNLEAVDSVSNSTGVLATSNYSVDTTGGTITLTDIANNNTAVTVIYDYYDGTYLETGNERAISMIIILALIIGAFVLIGSVFGVMN